MGIYKLKNEVDFEILQQYGYKHIGDNEIDTYGYWEKIYNTYQIVIYFDRDILCFDKDDEEVGTDIELYINDLIIAGLVEKI